MKYGLIAGNGQFPYLVIDGARKAGEQLAVIALREETNPRIDELAENVAWIGIGQLGRMIAFFKKEGVTHAIMAGHVRHTQIFSDVMPDLRMVKTIWSLPRRNTDALIGGIASEFAKEGIEIIDSTFFVKDRLAPDGTLTKRKPTDLEIRNIEYGLMIANSIAGLDLGQTVVIRGKACVAIEAMEGTDAAIRRAGELAKGKLTVVKVAKPDQDMRFDVPVVGLTTIESMIDAGATCLSITAGMTLIFDRKEMIELADKHKISIVGSSRETNRSRAT